MRRLALFIAFVGIAFADLSSADAGSRIRLNRRYVSRSKQYYTGVYRAVPPPPLLYPPPQPYPLWYGDYFDPRLDFEYRGNEMFYGGFGP